MCYAATHVLATHTVSVGLCKNSLLFFLKCVASDDSTLVASQVVLATGGTQDSIKLPLIAALADRFKLPLRNGLPLLDQDLQWCEGISVVGVCVCVCVCVPARARARVRVCVCV